MGGQRAWQPDRPGRGRPRAPNADILDRATGAPRQQRPVDGHGAEAALITGDDTTRPAGRKGRPDRIDRGGAYWLRLRGFCQLKADQKDAAPTDLPAGPAAGAGGGGDVDYARPRMERGPGRGHGSPFLTLSCRSRPI
ncbi:hypothetical protein ACRAWD_28605 [Caulobacter segnis]